MRRGGKADLILSHQSETIFKENGELIHGLFPAGGSTIGSNVAQRQKDQLCSPHHLITWEMAARLDDLAQSGLYTLDALDGVGRLDDAADLRRKGKEWNDVCPCP